jgi:hypothetical protein
MMTLKEIKTSAKEKKAVGVGHGYELRLLCAPSRHNYVGTVKRKTSRQRERMTLRKKTMKIFLMMYWTFTHNFWWRVENL